LYSLLLQAQAVTPDRDAKLGELKVLLRERIEAAPIDKDGKANRKAVVFTAFADTADYLFGNLKEFARSELGIHIAKVTGGAGGTETTLGRADFNEILTNFAPRSKKRVAVGIDEIDLLIATDCISEGQNLQDCGFLVNYDIHWNPVRLIQRFGRIDRIGSRFDSIQMVNFWPVEDLNQYINLKNRVESRMALADIAATAEDNILGNPVKELVEDDLKYRDHQLLKLQKEVLDMEELEDISLGDFSLEEFRLELLEFLEEDAKRLRELPLGMYAVVAATEEISPGAVFCLRAKNPDPHMKPSNVNPTAPYYLLYIERDASGARTADMAKSSENMPVPIPSSNAPDSSRTGERPYSAPINFAPHVPFGVFGNDMSALGSSHGLFAGGTDSEMEAIDSAPLSHPVVKLGFAQAKGVLAMLRELCVKQTAPDEALCEAFAEATQGGHDMSLVNELVQCAVDSCGEKLQEKTLSGLTQRGATLLAGGAKTQTSDFELVTWFVIA